jgi:hypothetical protein
LLLSYRGDQQLPSSSLGRGTRPTVPIIYGGYTPPNYAQQSLRGRHGHQFLQPRYSQATTNSHMRPPMGSHQSGQPAWPPPYGVGEGMPWGNFTHSYSRSEKHLFFGIINHAVPICRRNRCAFIYDRRFTLVPSKERLWEHSLVWTQRTAIHCQDKLFVRVKSTLAIDFSFLQCCICIAPLGPPLSRQLRTLMIYNTIGRYSIVCVPHFHLLQLLDPREPRLMAA